MLYARLRIFSILRSFFSLQAICRLYGRFSWLLKLSCAYGQLVTLAFSLLTTHPLCAKILSGSAKILYQWL